MIQIPDKNVSISPFLVTQKEYASLKENKSLFRGDALPVESVTWRDALEFCNALSERDGLKPCYSFKRTGTAVWDRKANGYRLPTRTEWRAAAMSGTRPLYSGGTPFTQYAWFSDNAKGKTHPVGTMLPNAWGFYDMCGNVSEWVWNGKGDLRHIMGGSWAGSKEMCRINRLDTFYPNVPSCTIGFRLAQSV